MNQVIKIEGMSKIELLVWYGVTEDEKSFISVGLKPWYVNRIVPGSLAFGVQW